MCIVICGSLCTACYCSPSQSDLLQVILYGLMMSERYPSQPQHGGLLLYLKAKHMQGLPFNAQDKRGKLLHMLCHLNCCTLIVGGVVPRFVYALV